MTIREALQPQLKTAESLTQFYFDIKDEDKTGSLMLGQPPFTDETWAKYKKNRLLTFCGHPKVVGDKLLWIGVFDGEYVLITTCVERELDQIEEQHRLYPYHQLRNIPVVISKAIYNPIAG